MRNIGLLTVQMLAAEKRRLARLDADAMDRALFVAAILLTLLLGWLIAGV